MVSSHWISKGVSILILSSALAVGFWIKDRNFHYPTSDDASIDAEVVHVAPAVGGRLMALSVRENDKVKRGDLLFKLDPEPYRLMVEQAEADLELAKAVLEERHRG
jgi:multidrug efflux system membrane fusion protein